MLAVVSDSIVERFPMRLDFKEICRGEGKTYIRVQANLSCESNTLSVRCVNRGEVQLPCRLLPLRRFKLSTRRDYVLVVFTSKRSQMVVFEEFNLEGSVVGTACKKILPFMSKWSSRLNGVFRKKECAAIRNFDWKGRGRQSILTFDQFVGKEGSFLLRGSLFASCQCIEDAFITVFDQNGERIECKVRFLADAPASFKDGADAQLREFRFSVELPQSGRGYESYCFLAGNKGDSESNCFEALESYALENLADRHAESFRDAFVDPRYGFWMKTRGITAARAAMQETMAFEYAPLFSVIVPLFKTPLDYFEEMVESVLGQTYTRWELVLVNASPDDEALANAVSRYAEADSRIKVVPVSRNLGITENTNEGIKVSKGDFLSFFDHDDVLEPNILFEYVSALNRYDDIDLLYCDEDKLFPDGSYGSPMFKPDFGIDLLRDNNYICHMLTVRKSLHERLIPADKALDGAQDHNLALQVAEQGRRIFHVPSILYHWRMSETSTASNASSKPYATEAGILAVQRHLDRLGVRATVSCAHGRDFRYKTDYEIEGNPPISLVLPTRGRAVLGEFLQSVKESFEDVAFDVVLAACENDVDAARTVADEFDGEGLEISVVAYPGEFNYARAVNIGVEGSSGEVLLLLHDDAVFRGCDDVLALLRHSLRQDVGVVGPMVCDIDGTIQQAGLVYVDGEIVPLSAGMYHTLPGYVFRPLSTQNLSAVSGICMATKRSTFERVGGFDERFEAHYGDVDYCFRVQDLDLLVVYTPEAVVEHRGSMTRGREVDKLSSPAYYREKALLFERWATRFAAGDPYFNKNFSRVPGEACAFKLGSEETITL